MGKRFNLVLLGHPSSGKTAFLTLLARDCQESVSPSEAQEALRENLTALEQGRGLEATRDSATDWHFGLPGAALDVRTGDYAGELTRALTEGFRNEGMATDRARELQGAIHQSQAVLFFVDCHALARAGGWRPWCETHAMPLLRFIKDVISDQRRHPVMFLLTRCDLVEDDFLRSASEQVKETVRDLRLNGEVAAFRAFTSRAGKPAPAGADLPDEYLAPAGAPEPDPDPVELLRSLWRLHSKTKGLPLSKAAVYILVVLALVVALASVLTRERPVTAKQLAVLVGQVPVDLTNEDEAKHLAGRLYVAPGANDSRPPLSRVFMHWLGQFEAEDADLTAAKQAYTGKVTEGSERIAHDLTYRAQEGVWRPAETERLVRCYEDDLRTLNAADDLARIASVRKGKLDEVMPAVGSLAQGQLQSLAYEYQRIGEPIPDVVRQRLTDIVYLNCLGEVAAKLKEYAGAAPAGLRTLYEDKIPGILDKALSVGPNRLSGERRTELEDARRYLNQLRQTQKLEFHLEAFIQKKVDEKGNELAGKAYTPAIRIAVTPKVASAERQARYYYPCAGTDTSKDEDNSEWPQGRKSDKEYGLAQDPNTKGGMLSCDWYYGDRIAIDVWDEHSIRKDQHLVSWDSDRLDWEPEFADGGYDLPGLSFMVFWAAHAQYTLGVDRPDCWYRLALKKEGNGYEMLHIPSFLREANMRRPFR